MITNKHLALSDWSKLYFLTKYSLQMLAIWNSIFNFANNFKKIPSLKIVCPVQVYALLKTLLRVATADYNLFTASSSSWSSFIRTTESVRDLTVYIIYIWYILRQSWQPCRALAIQSRSRSECSKLSLDLRKLTSLGWEVKRRKVCHQKGTWSGIWKSQQSNKAEKFCKCGLPFHVTKLIWV